MSCALTTGAPASAPLTRLISESLNDCSSRIEWLTSFVDQGISTQNKDWFDALYQTECKSEKFLNQAMGNLPDAADALDPSAPHKFNPDAHPIPVACRNA